MLRPSAQGRATRQQRKCAGSNFNGMALPDVVYLQAQGGPSPQAPAAAAEQMLRQMGCGAFVAA